MEIIDRRTGEVTESTEFLENLRALEDMVSKADEEVATIKDNLKVARDARDELVRRLRAAVRDGKVLPLFEGEQ
jgi:hypothetical protein